MSVSEWTEGLKKKVASHGIVNPSVGYADSFTFGEPFGKPPLHLILHRSKYIIYNIAA